MSESPEERTKRTFIQYLDSVEWCYQYSFIYTDSQVAKRFGIEDGKRLRKRIARKYNTQAFLYRLCLINRKHQIINPIVEYIDEETGEVLEDLILEANLWETKYKLTAFHTFFTTKKILYRELVGIMETCLGGGSIVLRNRKILKGKLNSYRKAVKAQQPHNLKGFFGGMKINRIALLNVKALYVHDNDY